MADSIKIGTSGTTFKVGSDDVTAIYLGNTLVYSGTTPPTPTYQWVLYSEGDTLPSIQSYGIRVNVDEIYAPSEDPSYIQILDENGGMIDVFEIGYTDGEWYASYAQNIITDDVYDSSTGYITIIFSDYDNKVFNNYYSLYQDRTDLAPFDIEFYVQTT